MTKLNDLVVRVLVVNTKVRIPLDGGKFGQECCRDSFGGKRSFEPTRSIVTNLVNQIFLIDAVGTDMPLISLSSSIHSIMAMGD